MQILKCFAHPRSSPSALPPLISRFYNFTNFTLLTMSQGYSVRRSSCAARSATGQVVGDCRRPRLGLRSSRVIASSFRRYRFTFHIPDALRKPHNFHTFHTFLSWQTSNLFGSTDSPLRPASTNDGRFPAPATLAERPGVVGDPSFA